MGPHSWSGGDSQTPTFTLQEHRGARIPSAQPPPPIINFHQWPSGARGGRGTRRFPLIAKINTLKFLQEAEECGTAGKNCFIICNNTKAGGGAGGSRERRGKAEAKGWPQRWGQPQLSTSTGTSSPKDVARGSRCRGGRSRAQPQLSELLPAAPCLSFPSDFYVAGGQSAAPTARRCRPLPTPLGGLQRSTHTLGPPLTSKLGVLQPPRPPSPTRGCFPWLWQRGRDKASRCAPGAPAAGTGPPPPCSPLGAEIKGIFLPLGNQIKASHLPRRRRRPRCSGRGDNRHFQHAGG